MSTAEESTANERDDTPDASGVAFALLAAAVSVVAVAVAPAPAGVALVALVVLPVGVIRGSRRIHTLGAAGLFGAVLLAGVLGAPVGRMLLATTAAVVAWDAGENAIGLGSQLGPAAASGRAHLVHVGATTVAAAVVAGVGFAVYRFASANQPPTAVVLLLVAALTFAWLLDR